MGQRPGCTLMALAVGLSHSARESLTRDESCSSCYWLFLLFSGCLLLIRAGKLRNNHELAGGKYCTVSYGLVCMGFRSPWTFRIPGSFYLVLPSLGLRNSILVLLHPTERGRKRRFRSPYFYALEINSKIPCGCLKADSSESYPKKAVYQSIR